jgi:hypothetical protein
MLNAREDIAYTYVFAGVIPALISVILTVTDNSVAIRKAPERIVSETTYTALVLAAAQARSSLIDFMAA